MGSPGNCCSTPFSGLTGPWHPEPWEDGSTHTAITVSLEVGPTAWVLCTELAGPMGCAPYEGTSM